jgi:uncharacterized protein
VHDKHSTTLLWSGSQLVERSDDAPPWDWLSAAYAAFNAVLLGTAEQHPCYFGVQGQQRGDNWFWAFDERLPDTNGAATLAAALVVFQQRAWTGAKRQSLVVFAGPPEPEPTLERHHAVFWQVLQALTTHDPAPWPARQPTDPRDPAWQWSFAGEPWFVFAGSPAYMARRSRNLGSCLTLVFQTRRVFDGLAGSTAAGKAAKRRIRERLVSYDALAPHPHLGNPLHSSTFKWRQYALPDDQRTLPEDACPFVNRPSDCHIREVTP